MTKGKRQSLQRKIWTCSVNDDKNLNLPRNKLQMDDSITGVYSTDKSNTQAKNSAKRDTNKYISPADSAKLSKKS